MHIRFTVSSPGTKEFFRKMFDIYTDLDPRMLEARQYFEK